MTTATETLPETAQMVSAQVVEDEQIKSVAITSIRSHQQKQEEETDESEQKFDFTYEEKESESFKMSDAIDQQLINSIEQYVQQNMNRGTINLEDMAEAMGMSMKPFFQKVHDITGKTPAEIVRDLRLRHACILLQRTNINMSELASHVGFATGEHFINLFKERFGMTPSEYRLKHRK
jgi:AraC-like DNA-binding protein